MSTTLENFAAVDDESNECPHGNRDLDESVMYCWYCWDGALAQRKAIDDPTRGGGE